MINYIIRTLQEHCSINEDNEELCVFSKKKMVLYFKILVIDFCVHDYISEND